jgi:hypothetical protein
MVCLCTPAVARAQSVPVGDPSPQPLQGELTRPPETRDDPTGGAYTTPTLLFVPAAAVPVWTVRVVTSLDVQGPTVPDRLATSDAGLGFQPGIGGEIGLPLGFTIGAGSRWVGGDVSPTPISGGLSPYAQARYRILGAESGRGFLLGASVTYKFVGFQGDPGEMEWALSAQYRAARWEAGLQGVFGKDFGSAHADVEVHAYVLYRFVPQLGLGAAGQVRLGVVSEPDEPSYDVIGGALASLTLSRWQLGLLGGGTTVGLGSGQVGGLGEVFATVRF